MSLITVPSNRWYCLLGTVINASHWSLGTVINGILGPWYDLRISPVTMCTHWWRRNMYSPCSSSSTKPLVQCWHYMILAPVRVQCWHYMILPPVRVRVLQNFDRTKIMPCAPAPTPDLLCIITTPPMKVLCPSSTNICFMVAQQYSW